MEQPATHSALTLKTLRTDSDHPDFRALVALLDHDLAIRDGDEHAFYAQFNKVDKIKHVVLAFWGNQVVACGAIRAFSEEAMEVKRMFVRPEFRGKGFAGAVLSVLETWAKEQGFAPEAIGLYQKAGYAIIPNYGQYAEVENSVCMEKRLD
jgi:putative acetyltransferase